MKRPAIDKLLLAAEWLMEYDEDAEECCDMDEVANWLRSLATASEQKAIEAEAIRQLAKEKGVTVTEVKSALKRVRLRKASS